MTGELSLTKLHIVNTTRNTRSLSIAALLLCTLFPLGIMAQESSNEPAMPIVKMYAHKVYEPQVTPGRNIKFDQYFYDRAVRIDFTRTGNYAADTIALAGRPQRFGSSWTGRRGNNSIDPIEGGLYRIVIADSKTKQVLYTFSYNSLFSEYRTLPEAKAGKSEVFEEVFILPHPKQTVDIFFQQRDDKNIFRTQTMLILTMPERSKTKITSHKVSPKALLLHGNGKSAKAMDIVIVPEGYGPQDSAKLSQDLRTFTNFALEQAPFQKHKRKINVWGLTNTAGESGITDPVHNIKVNSLVGCSYGTFGSDRYLMTQEVFQLYNVLQAADVPCDHIIIMANSETYGGGGIYNYYTVSSVQQMSRWILPHELGHSIGGLADEYVENGFDDMHPHHIEPVEPNITTLVNFDIKWKNMLPEGTPIPTAAPSKPLPREECGALGVYEGAGYSAKGVYRPTPHCMMRDYHPFCPICAKHLDKVIDSFIH